MGQRQIRLEELSYDECMSYTPKHTTLGAMVWKMIQRIHYPAEPDIVDELSRVSKSHLCRMVSIAKSSEHHHHQSQRMYQALVDSELPLSCILMVQPWTQALLDKLTSEQRSDLKQRIDPTGSDRLIDAIHAIQHITASRIEYVSGARTSRSKRVHSPRRR